MEKDGNLKPGAKSNEGGFWSGLLSWIWQGVCSTLVAMPLLGGLAVVVILMLAL